MNLNYVNQSIKKGSYLKSTVGLKQIEKLNTHSQ